MSFLNQKLIRRSDLAADLRAAGIEPASVLVVHSSLSRIGWIQGGPAEFVHALQDVLTPEGTLVMPTFTFNLRSWNLPPFDPWNSASRVGLLTETFRRMEGVQRSLHPTHSVAAWGQMAKEIVGEAMQYQPLGIGSPLDRVRGLGGKILLVGVGQNRNSTVHLAESIAGMPYLHIPFSDDGTPEVAEYLPSRGARPHPIVITEVPGSSEAFENLDKPLLERGVVQVVSIGNAQAQLMESSTLCDTVAGMLRENPLLLLTTAQPSEITTRRRRYMKDLMDRGRWQP